MSGGHLYNYAHYGGLTRFLVLDDNTYTNKTWAKVSGISVQEIHIMEVEFLSNVRYSLFASKDEWNEWHAKLRRFSDFYHKASLVPEDNEQFVSKTPALHISPSLGPTPPLPSLSPASKLPSPPMNESLRALSSWNLSVNNGPSYASPLPRLGNEIPPSVNSRKRSRDEPTEEHPVKRAAMPNPSIVTLPPSSALPSIPTLPLVLTPTPMSAPSSHAPFARSVSQLPRPNISSSNNLTPSISNISHQLPPVPARTVPLAYSDPAPTSHWVPSTTVPSMSNGVYTAPVSLPDPGRHHHNPFGATSATVSPALSAYSAHTPSTYLPPSFWLANCDSPYRPVGSVNTLLIPAPPASLQQHRNAPCDHMHYQPLGKSAAERRTGLVPYFHQETWPQGPIAQPVFQPIRITRKLDAFLRITILRFRTVRDAFTSRTSPLLSFH